jgi:hypothetical protein
MGTEAVSETSYKSVRFEILTAIGMNVTIFWDIAPCTSHMNQRFGGESHFHLQGIDGAEQ